MDKTKLRLAIERAGISQSETARRSQVDIYRLNRYVTGAARLGPALAERLANVLNVKATDLMEVRHEG